MAGTSNFKLKSRLEDNIIDLTLTDLNGSLKKCPVSGEFHYQRTADNVHLIDSDLHFGNAKIKANGKINDQVVLDWNINIPQLQDILAEYSLSGSLKQPRVNLSQNSAEPIQAQVKLNNIQHGEHALGKSECTTHWHSNPTCTSITVHA